MGTHKLMSAYERERELKHLIADAEQLKFSPSLIREYKQQLSEVQEQVKKMKERKVKLLSDERGAD